MADIMANISLNREFIDTIYFYQLHKEIAENLDASAGARRNAYERMVEYYISLITRCLQNIHLNEINKKIQMEYINYLAWNSDVIYSNLDAFSLTLQHQLVQTQNEIRLISEIKIQPQILKETKAKFLELDCNELGKVKEYAQAYRIVKDSKTRRRHMRLIENLSYRFVDYLNTLTTKRCCFDGFGRADCTIEDVKAEAHFILTTLNDCGNLACYALTKNAWDAFISFRETDLINRSSQDLEIASALDMSHARANENRLQRLERQLKETCDKISNWLGKKLNESFKTLKILSAPIFHPLDTLHNLWFATRHPICTIHALVKWIKQDKWKAGIIILCGLVIGVGAGILIGGPLLVGAFSLEVPCGVTGGLITFATVGIMPLLAAAGEGGVLVKEADRQIEDEENKNKTKTQAVLDEVESIKRKVRNEEFIRSRLREARKEAELQLAVIIRAEQESAQLLDQQLTESSHEQMAPALYQCQEALAITVHELTETRDARKKIIVALNEMRRDHRIINDAQDAASRIQKSSKDSFTLIGVTKQMMNLDEMAVEARSLDYTWIVKSCMISFIVLIFAVILYWFLNS